MKYKLKFLGLLLLFACNIERPEKEQHTIEYSEDGKIKSISVRNDSVLQKIIFSQESGLVDTIQRFNNEDKIGTQMYFNSKGNVHFLEQYKKLGKYAVSTKWYVFDNELDIRPDASFFVLGEHDQKQNLLKIYYSTIKGKICKVDSTLPQLEAFKCGDEDSLRLGYMTLLPSKTGYYNIDNGVDNLLFSPEIDK